MEAGKGGGQVGRWRPGWRMLMLNCELALFSEKSIDGYEKRSAVCKVEFEEGMSDIGA